MKKLFFSFMMIIALFAAVFTSCRKGDSGNKKPTSAPNITMTTKKSGEVLISMQGENTVTVNWGDATPSETKILSSVNSEFRHTYSNTSSRTITITGNNITHLICRENELTSLDVSKNVALLYLDCTINQLKELDVRKNISLTSLNLTSNQLTILDLSNNIALAGLGCYGNLLTELNLSNNTALLALECSVNPLGSLDVSKNTALTRLLCFSNQLSSLDLSKNTLLTLVSCSNNLLSTTGLNTLFGTLHNNAGNKTIHIDGNSGTATCNQSIATGKGWTVIAN
jgi:hypothetical protein